MSFRNMARHLLLPIAIAAGAAALLAPDRADAFWRGGVWFVGPPLIVPPPVYLAPPVYVAPPPVVIARPPVVYVPRPYARWIRPHYNRFGYWVPGHWG